MALILPVAKRWGGQPKAGMESDRLTPPIPSGNADDDLRARMTALLLSSFVLACIIGAIAAWSVPFDRVQRLIAPLLLICSASLAGALVVAAEAGSAAARYLGLAAILLASASFCGGFFATRRSEKARQVAPRP